MFNFDFLNELEKRNIAFKTSGRNIGQNYVGMDCPFCGDERNHLGLNKSTGRYHCFICGAKGGIEYLIYSITGERIKKYDRTEFIPEQNNSIDKVELNFNPDLSEQARNYLVNRNYDPDELIKKYKIQDGGLYSKFKYRIIIPYFVQNKLVTYSGRDYSGKQEPKYLHLPRNKSIFSSKDVCYGIESCTDTAIIVEGVFDAWRIGSGTIALSGKIPTENQLNQIKQIKRLFIMFDKDAEQEAQDLAINLETVFNDVHLILIDKNDPDCLSNDEVIEIKKQIFG